MIFPNRLSPGVVLRIGYVCLIAACVSKFAFRHTSLPENLVDGVVGFLYGLTIGTLLLGVWLKSRRRTNGCEPTV